MANLVFMSAGPRVAARALGIAAIATAIVGTLVTAARAADDDSKWALVVDESSRMVSWTGSRGFPSGTLPRGNPPGSGYQIFSTFGAQLTVDPHEDWQIEVLARGGWTYSRQTTAGSKGSIETFTDTVLNGTLTYFGFDGLQPFVSLNLNLPTGRTILRPGEIAARMDSDIVDVGNFGEGFNIGPTIGTNVAWSDRFNSSFSVGMTHRGAFDRDVDGGGGLSIERIRPAGEAAMSASLAYAEGRAALSGAVSFVFPTGGDVVDGVFQFESGRRANIALDGSWKWSDADKTAIQLSMALAEKNKIFDSVLAAAVTEQFNSNSILYKATLEQTHTVDKWTLGANAGVSYRDRNAWRISDMEFVPAKIKYSIGASADYKVTDTVSLNLRADRFWVTTFENPDKIVGGIPVPGLSVPIVANEGWVFSLGGTLDF